MHYTKIFSFLFAGIALFAAVSCAGVNPAKEPDLAGRRFVLESVNGIPFASGFIIPEIEFAESSQENLHVSGQVCNRFMGRGKLAGNILTVDPMASTRMLCPDDALNKLEHTFSGMMQNGAKVTFSGNRLTLAGDGVTFVYKEKPRVP